MKESIKILHECAELQLKKSNDYQNPLSTIRQADYYPRGFASILDIIHTKVLRMRSVLEAMENDPNYNPNFESLEDSAKDLINYASFAAAFIRGGIDGQDPNRDFLNRVRLPIINAGSGNIKITSYEPPSGQLFSAPPAGSVFLNCDTPAKGNLTVTGTENSETKYFTNANS
jgi:hypothetical protein